ncbi:unnamed protein product [Cuscuta europaea]|uniref:Arabidopsis retrotransposon Orf1 C-terminal domain-containing protein n=2 Tax=cellular organisms TaxID=131567 RepID=A0A9P0ZGR4_CUSEU|nr:unnamed protein product [Cuscuta europaea]
MAPRKEKGQSSSTRTIIPGYEDILFVDNEQRTRFMSTIERQVKPSRFLCLDALKELGVYTIMKKFFHELHMDKIFKMQYNSNEKIIYEFLSSVHFENNEEDFRDDKLRFRLFNHNHTITKLEFAEHFGIPVPYQKSISDNTAFGHTLWTKMTGETKVSSSQLYISHVQHPVLRLFLKFLANSLLGRPNNHHTRMGDVCLISVALFRIHVDFNLCNLMWAHLKKESVAKGAIVVGGVIMHLATKFGYTDDSPIPDYCLMNISWLGHSGCTSFSHTVYGEERPKNMYNWHIHPKPLKYFLLPNPELPQLHFKTGKPDQHYLFPNALPPHLQEPEQELPQNQPDDEPYEQLHSHPTMSHDFPEQSQNPPPPDFFQQLLEGQQQLLEGIAQMDNRLNRLEEEQRVGFQRLEDEQRAGFQRLEELREADRHRYEEDQHRFYGPMYSFMAQQGSFHTMANPPPPPSWYDPTHWGNFGGSGSGGGGYDDGDGGDTYMGDGGQGSGFGGSYYGGEGGH